MTDDAPKKELTAKEIAARFAAMAKKGDAPAVTGEMIDDVTRAELERWFGLPSYTQVDEGDLPRGAVVAPEDPEIVAVRERRERALAAIEPAMIDALTARAERRAAPTREVPPLQLRVREDVAICDLAAIERQHLIAEPREVEIPVEMQDDLKECAPQALLRDMHRPELDFEKTFEVVDMAAEQRVDIVAMVADAMATRWGLTAADVGAASPAVEATAMISELRAERRTPWPALWNARPLPNRKVT